jgi:hypothetical protein
MQATYWNLYDIGNIFWVWLYAAQAWWIMKIMTPHKPAVIIASLFLVLSFIIQYATLSFGYLDYAALSPQTRIVLLCAGFGCIAITAISWNYISNKARV